MEKTADEIGAHFATTIKAAQRHTLQAALELLNWKDDEEKKMAWSFVYNLGAGKNIIVNGKHSTGKSHIGLILNAMGISTFKEVSASGIMITINSEDETYVDYYLSDAVTAKEMEVFHRLLSAMHCLTHALKHYDLLKKT
jgi:hypothetical protein